MTNVTSPDIHNRDWVAARLESGDTVAAIAAAAAVSRQTASSWLKRHGLTAAKQPLKRPSPDQMAADYTRVGAIRPLATEYKISPATMRTWLFEAGVEMSAPGTTGGRPRIQVNDAEIKRLRDEGLTLTAIAEELDMSYETVRRRLLD